MAQGYLEMVWGNLQPPGLPDFIGGPAEAGKRLFEDFAKQTLETAKRPLSEAKKYAERTQFELCERLGRSLATGLKHFPDHELPKLQPQWQ